MMDEKQNLISLLSKNYLQVISAIIMFVILLPLFIPLHIPIAVTPQVQQVYDMIKNTSPDKIILIKYDVTPGHWAEQGPTMDAMLTQVVRLHLKFVIFNTDPSAPQTQLSVINYLNTEVPEFKTYVYGQDWASMGYIAGGETAIASLGNDVQGTFKKDSKGTPVGEIPIFKSLKTANDFVFVIDAASSASDPFWLIRQWQARYGTKILWVHIIYNEPDFIPYYASGQIVGMILGARGGSQYEILVNKPGLMVQFMDSANLTLVVIVLVTIIGNVEYFLQRRRIKK
jgi:hypothetical protein